MQLQWTRKQQYLLGAGVIEEELLYLGEELDGLLAMIADGVILGIELPATVVLKIEDTAPGMKAASASSRTKPATLSTGLVVQIPEYLTAGEHIKVNTTGEYIWRRFGLGANKGGELELQYQEPVRLIPNSENSGAHSASITRISSRVRIFR
jgi:hypothetical protein